MDSFLKALEASLRPSPFVIAIGFAIVVLIPIILHFVLAATDSYVSLPSVLLVGPSGAGKTALLALFERGPLHTRGRGQDDAPNQEKQSRLEPPLTHTSLAPACAELAVSDADPGSTSFCDDLESAGATARKFLLVDTPGHPKLRRHALARLAGGGGPGGNRARHAAAFEHGASTDTAHSRVRAVVFVVDAAALGASDVGIATDSSAGGGIAAAAEFLHDALLALQQRQHALQRRGKAVQAVSLLVAANKMDLFTALPAVLVRAGLEAEIGRIRQTRSKGLLDSGAGAEDDAAGAAAGGGEEQAWLGEWGSEKFTFAQMGEFDIEVDVLAGNVVGEGPGVEGWWRWIAERV